MKYNRSEIMKAAWGMKRSYSCRSLTFGECLKRAWANAKTTAADTAEFDRLNGKQFEDGETVTFEGYTCTLTRWTKGNHDRIYLNDGSRKGCGYVDLRKKTDCTINVCWSRKMAQAVLSMEF